MQRPHASRCRQLSMMTMAMMTAMMLMLALVMGRTALGLPQDTRQYGPVDRGHGGFVNNVPFPVKGEERGRRVMDSRWGNQPPPPPPPQQDVFQMQHAAQDGRKVQPINNVEHDHHSVQEKQERFLPQINSQQQQSIELNHQQGSSNGNSPQSAAVRQRVETFNKPLDGLGVRRTSPLPMSQALGQQQGVVEEKAQQDVLAQSRLVEQKHAQDRVRQLEEDHVRQQELHRQQEQDRIRQQQDAIRRQLQEQRQFQQQRQQPDSVLMTSSDNSNNQPANQLANKPAIQPIVETNVRPVPEAVPSKMPVPTPHVPRVQSPEALAAQPGQNMGNNERPVQDFQAHPQNLNLNNRDTVFNKPQPHQNNSGQLDIQGGFQKIPEGSLNTAQREKFPSEQQVKEIGGMHINWDWDDFSLTYEQYGAAEMKVRRSPHASTGEPWPLPQYYTKKDKSILVVSTDFHFSLTTNISCDVIDQAIERYKNRIRLYSMEDMYDNLQNAEGTNLDNPEDKYHSLVYEKAPTIKVFSLKIRKPCTVYPTMESDESYDLVMKKSGAYLWANEVWGLLRGLETLSQLIWRGPDDRLYVKETVISDYPRFPHRGILIDSSRHFIFKEVLYDMMDAMEMNKMNVLHWHIVDDQSFPYESQVYPELSAKGAYHPTFVYSLQDIADLLEYARMRGIRIIPEFDTPGHTYSWGLSRPELLTQCYYGSSVVKGYLGPIHPVRNSTYHFLKTLFAEILHVFKDNFIHLGGDEVPLGCWQSNPEVSKFGDRLSQNEGHPAMDQSLFFGSTSPSMRLVYEYYVNRLMSDIKELGQKRNGVRFIMWQEVMNNDLKLPNDTLIQVWMGDMGDVSRAINKGYNVLYSSCWYLDHIEYGVKWPKYYSCDPADASYGYSIDEKKVKGGEACLWSEYIDNENLMQTTWPRSSAVAERLWSSKETRNLDQAGERLSEHRCRMLRRGLSVGQISGPDYCLKRGPRRGMRAEAGCQGDSCNKGANSREEEEENSSIQFRLRSQGRASSDCTWSQSVLQTELFQLGGNVTLLAMVAVVAFIVLVSVSRGNSKLNPLRACRQRTLLLVFVAVVVIYFMCYTTMWMHVFEFSGSIRKKRPSPTGS